MYYPVTILNCVQVRARVPFTDGEWSKLVPVGKIVIDRSVTYTCNANNIILLQAVHFKEQLMVT